MMKQGLTWRSALLTVIVIIAAVVAFSYVLRFFRTEYDVSARVADDRVVESQEGCFWEIDVEFRNDSDRAMSLSSVELVGVGGSSRGVLGVVEPGTSLERTYRQPLACGTEPSSLGASELEVVYRPSLSTGERSVTAPLP